MSDLLGTAVSGLTAFQRALDTTGHNISNVDTEGYTRQQVSFETREPEAYSNGFVGNGVDTTTIRRVYDEYLTMDVRAGTSGFHRYDTYHDLASDLDNLLADPEAGLSPALSSFFSSVQDVANDPTSSEARQVMLSEGEALADRFHYLDEGLQQSEQRANDMLRGAVDEVNSLAASIGELNHEIVKAQGKTGQPPNDLLDQRDLKIEQLSQYVDVKTVDQPDGSTNVFIGSGQSLVVGTDVAQLSADEGAYTGSGNLEIYLGKEGSASKSNITNQLRNGGGEVGGVLQFKEDILEPAQDSLGRVATSLGMAFNEQHEAGIDLDGNLGSAFFDVGEPAVFGSLEAGSDASVDVSLTDASQLEATEYQLRYDGASWTLSRASDGQTWTSGTGAFNVDGMAIAVNGTTPVGGDKFLIQPVRNGASEFDAAIDNTRAIAAGSAVKGEAATDATGLPTNSGSARISSVAVADPATFSPLAGDITLTYDAAAGEFQTSLGTSFAYDPAGTETTVSGVSFRISGTAADGDQFILSNNSAAGDNGNALQLAALETEGILNGGIDSLQDGYGKLVADVGSRTSHADSNRVAQESRLRQAEDARSSVSGVNLDEEAAKLLEYQQAYQAAAKVISAADELFQSLLDAV